MLSSYFPFRLLVLKTRTLMLIVPVSFPEIRTLILTLGPWVRAGAISKKSVLTLSLTVGVAAPSPFLFTYMYNSMCLSMCMQHGQKLPENSNTSVLAQQMDHGMAFSMKTESASPGMASPVSGLLSPLLAHCQNWCVHKYLSSAKIS